MHSKQRVWLEPPLYQRLPGRRRRQVAGHRSQRILTAGCRAAGSRFHPTTGPRQTSRAPMSTIRVGKSSAPTKCGSPSSAAHRSRSPVHKPARASWWSSETANAFSLILAPGACATSSRWRCLCRWSTTSSLLTSTSIITRTCHTYMPSRLGWDAGSRCACTGHRAARPKTASRR
jgi:hypothetical protein